MYPSLRLRLIIDFRETGATVPSRITLLIFLAQAESSIYLCRQPPSGYAMEWRTDGVHCRESTSTMPIVLKVAPVPGAAFSGTTMDQ